MLISETLAVNEDIVTAMLASFGKGVELNGQSLQQLARIKRLHESDMELVR